MSWRLLMVKQMWKMKFGEGLEAYMVLDGSMLTKHDVVNTFRAHLQVCSRSNDLFRSNNAKCLAYSDSHFQAKDVYRSTSSLTTA
jgi:hypothetical protein